MVNRIAQYLYAVAAVAEFPEQPKVPQPEPARGVTHYATATFVTSATPKWSPRHAEDVPRHLQYEDLAFQGRFLALRDALHWLRRFNGPRFARFEITHERPATWAVLTWTDGGYETLEVEHCRQITPLRYYTHEVMCEPNWRPASLLDIPLEHFTDEYCGLKKHAHRTIDRAVLAAVKANRKYQPGKPRKGRLIPRWTVVLATEFDALHQFDVLNCSGRLGSLTVSEQRRFHLVDSAWPIAPAVLAGIGGGL